MKIQSEYSRPERIRPDFNFTLRGLPNVGYEEFFNNKRKNESYGHAKIRVGELSLNLDEYFIDKCKDWMYNGYDQKPLSWHEKTIHKQLPDNYEAWLKGSWLCKEYFTVGFKNPVGVFYYPALNVWDDNQIPKNGFWIVHPGGMRQVIMKLFMDPNEEIDCLLFNTHGVSANFIHEFTDEVDVKNYLNNTFGIELFSTTFCADRGTLIPHTLVQTREVQLNLVETYKSLLNVLEQYSFKFSDGFTIQHNDNTRLVEFNTEDPIKYLKCLLTVPYFTTYPDPRSQESIFRKYEIEYKIT